MRRERDDKAKKLFALKRVVASSRECLEGARGEVSAARATAAVAAEASSPPPSGLLPLLASEEKKRAAEESNNNTVEVLMLFPFCGGGSLADAVEAKMEKEKKGEERDEQQRKTTTAAAAEEEILSVAPLLRLFAQVAEGLSRMHEGPLRLGHFDVKPHNIFLLKEERKEEGEKGEGGNAFFPFRALLGDWGSARRVPVSFSSHAEALALCEEAERSTTAAYRPPELWDPLTFAAEKKSCRCSGEEEDEKEGNGEEETKKSSSNDNDRSSKRREREVSGKADVWCLGACLFACLGDGRSPPEVAAGVGGGGSLSLAACSGRVEWPPCSLPPPTSPSPLSSASSPTSSSSSPSCPSCFVPSSAVRALVERCLSLEPEKRPSAAGFAEEARALAEGIEREKEKEKRSNC